MAIFRVFAICMCIHGVAEICTWLHVVVALITVACKVIKFFIDSVTSI